MAMYLSPKGLDLVPSTEKNKQTTNKKQLPQSHKTKQKKNLIESSQRVNENQTWCVHAINWESLGSITFIVHLFASKM